VNTPNPNKDWSRRVPYFVTFVPYVVNFPSYSTPYSRAQLSQRIFFLALAGISIAMK
jgi:hypothetical protein